MSLCVSLILLSISSEPPNSDALPAIKLLLDHDECEPGGCGLQWAPYTVSEYSRCVGGAPADSQGICNDCELVFDTD